VVRLARLLRGERGRAAEDAARSGDGRGVDEIVIGRRRDAGDENVVEVPALAHFTAVAVELERQGVRASDISV
jgi:hypothetical protein